MTLTIVVTIHQLEQIFVFAVALISVQDKDRAGSIPDRLPRTGVKGGRIEYGEGALVSQMAARDTALKGPAESGTGVINLRKFIYDNNSPSQTIRTSLVGSDRRPRTITRRLDGLPASLSVG